MFSNATSQILTGNVTPTYKCYGPKEFGVPKVVDLYVNISVSLILVVSVIGNILVVRGILISPTRPVSYLLIGNIAIAELLFAMNIPFSLYYNTRPWDWVFGQTICQFNILVSIACIMVIPLTLAALSVYRCCILIRPSIRLSKTRCNVRLFIFFSWLWGVSSAMPFAITMRIWRYPLCDGGETRSCTYIKKDPSILMYISIIPFIAHYMVPLLVIVICYGTVVLVVKKHIRRSTRNEESEMTETVHTNEPIGEEPSQTVKDRRQSCKILEMESKLLNTIYLIIIVYIICYTPENLVFLTWRTNNQFFADPRENFLFRRHTSILHALAMALHPICYGWMSGIVQKNFNCFQKS